MRTSSQQQPSSVPFQINSGEKFSCLALFNFSVDDAFPPMVNFGDEICALTYPPLQLDSRWQKLVGTLNSDRIKRANFFLLVRQPSQSPHLVDEEYDQLNKRILLFFYGILIQGIPDGFKGWRFMGAKGTNNIEINTIGELDFYYSSHSNLPYPNNQILVSEDKCHKAKVFADGMDKIFNAEKYPRLRRGANALWQGMKEQHWQNSIHQYVRALEALIKPEIRKSKRQFVHRCQTFSLANLANKKILEQCYDIRSKVEHLHEATEALKKYPISDREDLISQRNRQIQKLSFDAYLKIGSSSLHGKLFETDKNIDSFWSKTDGERKRIWGSSLDLSKIP